MDKVKQEDYNLKPFFEGTLGLQIQKAAYNRGTLTYYMYSLQHRKNITFERRPDTSMGCTICGVTRNIPARDAIKVALGHEPSQLEICRIIQEVILKMLDDQLDETKRQVGRDFDRFSRRGH